MEEVCERLKSLIHNPSTQIAVLSLLVQHESRASSSPQEQAEDISEALATSLESCCQTGENTAVDFILGQWQELSSDSAPDADLLSGLLTVAAKNGHHEIVRCLLSHGAPMQPSIPGIVAVNAAKEANLVDVFRVFIEDGGWDINAPPSSKLWPTLHYVVDRSELLAAFLKWGADPNAISHDGLTPLDAAAGRATAQAVDTLLAGGARLVDAYPLHQAAATSSKDALPVLNNLLALGVDVNARLFEYHPERVRLRTPDEDFGTPLHCAARSGAKQRIELLVEKGADTTKRSSKGRTPLEWAERARRPKVHVQTLALLSNIQEHA